MAKVGAVLDTGADIILLQDLRLNSSLNTTRSEAFENAFQTSTACNSTGMGATPFHIFTNSPSTKRGVAVVIKKNNEITDAQLIYKQGDGNAIGVKVEYTYGQLVIYSIYGPNSRDDAFYEDLGKEVTRARKSGDGLLVIGGDWNVVPSGLPPQVNPDLIDCGAEPNPINADAVREIMEANNLEDLYRIRHAEQRAYTFKHFSGRRVARSRLDFFLTSRQRLDPRKP